MSWRTCRPAASATAYSVQPAENVCTSVPLASDAAFDSTTSAMALARMVWLASTGGT